MDKDIIEKAVKAFQAEHETLCLEGNMFHCAKQHSLAIKNIREYERITNNRLRMQIYSEIDELRNFSLNIHEEKRKIRAEILGDILELRDFMINSKQQERSEFTEFLDVIFKQLERMVDKK